MALDPAPEIPFPFATNRSIGDAGHTQTHNKVEFKVNEVAEGIDRVADTYERGISVRKFGATGLATFDDGPAIQAAIDALTPLAGTVWQRTLFIPPGTYMSNQELTSNASLHIYGVNRLGTVIKVGPSFPSGGTLLSFLRNSSGVSPVRLENKVPGIGLRGFTLDGNHRAIQANALQLDYFDRAQIEGVYITGFRGTAFKARVLRESNVEIRTWLCGDPTHPVMDLDETGNPTTEGSNLNTFHGCVLALNMGDDLRIRAPRGISTRVHQFVQCVFHGLNEWIEDYADEFGEFALDNEGNYPCRIVLDNARAVFFSNCRFHLNGRGQPKFYMSAEAAGDITDNSLFIANSLTSFRTNSYTSRGIATVDTAANGFTLAGAVLSPARHHLQTGSRVRFGATVTGLPPIAADLPGGVTAGTDYYAVKTSDTVFKVATSRADALAGTVVDITSTGAGLVTQYDTYVTAAATDTLTAPTHRLTTGARFRVATDGGTVPGGLAAATDYFVIRADADTIKLATTPANAAAGTAIDITSTGSAVYIAPQDFVAHVDSGTLSWAGGNRIDGGAPTRGYFRVNDANTPAGKLLVTPGTSWAAGGNVPVAEYASGAGVAYQFDGNVIMSKNNTSLIMAQADGTQIQVAKMTPGSAVQIGALSGVLNAQLVATGTAQIYAQGVKRFDATNAGVAFNGGTPAKPTITGSTTDGTAVSQLLVALAAMGLINYTP